MLLRSAGCLSRRSVRRRHHVSPPSARKSASGIGGVHRVAACRQPLGDFGLVRVVGLWLGPKKKKTPPPGRTAATAAGRLARAGAWPAGFISHPTCSTGRAAGFARLLENRRVRSSAYAGRFRPRSVLEIPGPRGFEMLLGDVQSDTPSPARPSGNLSSPVGLWAPFPIKRNEASTTVSPNA